MRRVQRHVLRSTAVAAAAEMAGLVLEGRYRVDRLLARGGTSSVYTGVDLRLDREVAIKVMDERYARDRRFVDRFELEARSAAKLHHPNVVAVHDQGVHEGPGPKGIREEYVYLVMELLRGGTLRDLLDERGALDPALAVSIADPVLAALGAAHTAGLVHRDVKPENVLVGRDGAVKVADFGLVRALAGMGITTDDVILGTVAYLSPEQVTTGAADAASDVYSAGVLLYEMLTGQVPYTADTAMSVAYRHVNEDVPAPSLRQAAVPAALDELVGQATLRDHDSRPADANALREMLRSARQRTDLPTVPVPVPTADATEVIPTVTAAPPGATDPAGPRGTRMMAREAAETGGEGSRRFGKRTLLILLAVLLVLGAAGGTAGWWFGAGRWSTVPTVSGMTVAQAKHALQDADLHATVHKRHDNTVPAGKVIGSDPGAGKDALNGADVRLLVSSGRPVVPDITPGTSLASARGALTQADLTPKQGKKAYSTSVQKGKVVSVKPGPGSQLDVDATVTIVVSKGPPPKPVPDVTGMTKQQAFQALSRLGLQPYVKGKQFSPDAKGGTVVSTDPAAGTRIGSGDAKRVGVVLSNAVTVPKVVGRPVAKAKQALQQAGLQAKVKKFFGHTPHGKVLMQSESPGSSVRPGTTVTLTAFP